MRKMTGVRWTFANGATVDQSFTADRTMQSLPVDVVTTTVTLEILGTTAPGDLDYTPISEIASGRLPGLSPSGCLLLDVRVAKHDAVRRPPARVRRPASSPSPWASPPAATTAPAPGARPPDRGPAPARAAVPAAPRASPSTRTRRSDDPLVNEGAAQYTQYVRQQVDKLVTDVKVFTDAVRAGNVQAAKDAFAPSRQAWEAIEPIAGLVEDIDGAVDARVDDFANEDDPAWTGWHKLEYLLWVKNDIGAASGAAAAGRRARRRHRQAEDHHRHHRHPAGRHPGRCRRPHRGGLRGEDHR